MSVYYVFQGETYNEEKSGGYVWSPKLNNAGHKNAGYTMMTNIRKGDFILHNCNSQVVAISVALTDYYDAQQPYELSVAHTSVKWEDEGYRIDTNYLCFDTPLNTKDVRDWLEKHYIEGSAFTRAGRGKQQYMCHLANEHAIYLLEEAIRLQKDVAVIKSLKAALFDIVDDMDSEYNKLEVESINEIVEEAEGHVKPAWSGKREPQAMTTSSKTGREIPKRDPKIAADALEYANYLCEYNNEHCTFLRKNGKPYTEPHHLIPISKHRDFSYSVDVMENIVSLCSYCHNLLHYGRFEDKEPILEKLYNARIAALCKCGLKLTLEQLKSYYK